METETIHNPITGETLYVLESTPRIFKFEFRLKPNGAIAGEHSHPKQEQTITVLSGELNCQIGKTRKILRAGESATIPPNTVHHQWNPTENEVVAIEEHRPAKRMHVFFRVAFELAWDGKTDLEGVPHPLIGAALLSEFKDVVRPARLKHRILFGFLAPVSRLLGYREIIRRYINEFESGIARGPAAMMQNEERMRPEIVNNLRKF